MALSEETVTRLLLLLEDRPFDPAVGRLYAWSEHRAGFAPADPRLDDPHLDRRPWPVSARLAARLADRLDDLGLWVVRRRAAMRKGA